MLSSQTKDAVTSQAVTNLHQTLPGGLTAESLATAPMETIHECINKVGFWRRKTEYIQDAAGKLLERKGEDRGDVPNTLEGLCELKGVGPKMAFLALQVRKDWGARSQLIRRVVCLGYVSRLAQDRRTANPRASPIVSYC